jgi:predicted transcriptional regulator
MSAIKTLYQLLNIKTKVPDDMLRLLYLKDVWGLDQGTIAELEHISQPNVSRQIKKARESKSAENMILDFTAEELKFVQSLPRDIISDMQLIAFYNNILKLRISHPFFSSVGNIDQLRICALASLGVMNKKLEKMFNKTQATISMTIKRNSEKAAKVNRPMRFDTSSSVYDIEKIYPVNVIPPTPVSKKFTLAGGQN